MISLRDLGQKMYRIELARRTAIAVTAFVTGTAAPRYGHGTNYTGNDVARIIRGPRAVAATYVLRIVAVHAYRTTNVEASSTLMSRSALAPDRFIASSSIAIVLPPTMAVLATALVEGAVAMPGICRATCDRSRHLQAHDSTDAPYGSRPRLFSALSVRWHRVANLVRGHRYDARNNARESCRAKAGSCTGCVFCE